MARRASTNGTLGAVSREALEAELRRRERRIQTLVRRHAKLMSSAGRLEAQIRQLGGSEEVAASTPRRGRPPGSGKRASAGAKGARRGAKPGVGRPKNDKNLVEALAALLKGKTLNVTKAAVDVQKAGYKTTSPNFRTIVNQTLLKSDRFKRVGRGQYTSR